MAAEKDNIPYKIYLSEDEMPKAWYNVRADMKVKPAPLLNPGTGKPMSFDDLRPVFCDELIRQELDNDDREIPIPQEILDFYKMYCRQSGKEDQERAWQNAQGRAGEL